VLGAVDTVTADPQVAWDAVWPRDDPRFRYRLYALKDGILNVIAAAPDPGGVGQAIVTLHADARAAGATLGDEGRIGILDVTPDDGRDSGEWIINPFDRKEAQ
jgi:hypothetical protein